MGQGRERGKYQYERDINWLPLKHTQRENTTHNPGMCPDWKSNLRPLDLLDDTPTNRATPARAN